MRHCTPEFRVCLCLMNSDRVFADAIKVAQRLLWHTYDLPDAMKVVRLRKLVRSPTVQSALRCSSDTLLAFTLRAVELVIADQSQTDREMIRRLWDILLNNPHLIQAARGPHYPFGPTWLSVRPTTALLAG
jgi:hypothetical protein